MQLTSHFSRGGSLCTCVEAECFIHNNTNATTTRGLERHTNSGQQSSGACDFLSTSSQLQMLHSCLASVDHDVRRTSDGPEFAGEIERWAGGVLGAGCLVLRSSRSPAFIVNGGFQPAWRREVRHCRGACLDSCISSSSASVLCLFVELAVIATPVLRMSRFGRVVCQMSISRASSSL